jgi:hypothetical protein
LAISKKLLQEIEQNIFSERKLSLVEQNLNDEDIKRLVNALKKILM